MTRVDNIFKLGEHFGLVFILPLLVSKLNLLLHLLQRLLKHAIERVGKLDRMRL